MTEEVTGDCEVPAGCRKIDGYVRVRWAGVVWYAHRLQWALVNGPIPDGLYVLHHCDNRPCVNIDHLYLGTHQDNMDDMARRGRRANGNTSKTECRHGHPFDEANTRVDPATGARTCRACDRARTRIYKSRKRLGAIA